MSLRVGIVGLPNVGKSTLFNALTRAGAAVASYPFTTIEPNVGVVEVPDPRLDEIASIIKPDEVKPTTISFVDIAGLVQGAHQGEGLGNQFLGHIRDVDAIAFVVRCFQDENIAHINPTLDPLADIEIIDLELVLADLGTVERLEAKMVTAAKAQPKVQNTDLEFLTRLRLQLEGGNSAASMPLSTKDAEMLRSINLLTAKPRLYISNIGEDSLPNGGACANKVLAHARREGSEALVVSAQTEADLAEWQASDAAEYRQEMGLVRSSLEELILVSYRLLNLITFFTATGTKVVRAWTLREGQTALEAAGKIHSDMEHGFIRAEVVAHADLVAAGTMAAARDLGLLRLEGRDYTVRDGDVLHIRFSPPR